MVPWQVLKEHDAEVFSIIGREFERQRNDIELIASENYASSAVIATMANVFTNKYAEGRPHKRYYGGCEHCDELEELAIKRLCELFGARFANVQPHSGAQANAAALLALAKPGDRILGMDLSHGGHLTHGSKVNFSGIYFESHFYMVNEAKEVLDYDSIADTAHALKPKVIIAGASAYPRLIDFSKFREIADSVGAYLMVDMAHIAGLVAAGLHPHPLPHAHVVTSTTHKTLRGPRGGLILWNEEELELPLNKAVFPGTQGGPLEHIIAAKAVSFLEASQPVFKRDQKRTIENAAALADALKKRGFRLVSGGTDNHLFCISLLGEAKSGKDFEEALGKVRITVNKNTVPRETRSPFVTSGVRVGTPAMTTRGLGTKEMETIADLMHQTYQNMDDSQKLHGIKEQVHSLIQRFPLYPEWPSSQGRL